MENRINPGQLWFLKECREETRRRFLQLGKTVFCSRGARCLWAGDEPVNLFFLLYGKVQIYNLTKCGRKKILFILGQNHLANETLAGGRNTIFCETIEPSSFFVIRRETMLRLMEEDFNLTAALLRYQERKLWRLEHQLKNTVGSIQLERKLAAKLWKLARDFGIRTPEGILIDLEMSITFLADLLGAPRETASRLCRRLTEYGLIRMEKKKIYISDAERMAAFYKNGIPCEIARVSRKKES